MKLRLSDQPFYTIQGEGMFAGVPSLFIRTSGCNLRCWWCDTPYTSHRPEGVFHDVDGLINAALNERVNPGRHVVITGGEPMLFPREVAHMTDSLRAAGKVVTIETNGTIYDAQVRPHLWSVSPKLPGSEPEVGAPGDEKQKMHLTNMGVNLLPFRKCNERVDHEIQRVQFKFVICSAADLRHVEKMAEGFGLAPETIWLMPQGTTAQQIIEGGTWLAEECKSRRWNLCLRQHVILWGNKRSV